MSSFTNPSLYKNKAGQYEYFLGYEQTYASAKNIKVKLQGLGFANADIVPFINHTLITKSNAVSYSNEYKELVQYIEGEK
jgi:hypothetical protein